MALRAELLQVPVVPKCIRAPFAVDVERRNRVLTLATRCPDAPFMADNET